MIYLFLADGFEEVEAIAPVDVLRRCGIDVKTVGVTGPDVTGAHGMTLHADLTADDVTAADLPDAVILPGGMPGTRNLDQSDLVRDTLRRCARGNRLICAICAAPSVLGHLGLLSGKRATCFPGFENELDCAVYTAEPVTCDGNFITANGPGSALLFGEQIAARFVGSEAAHTVLQQMQYDFGE